MTFLSLTIFIMMLNNPNFIVAASPLEQFEVNNHIFLGFGGLDLSLNTVGLFFVFGVVVSTLLSPSRVEADAPYAMTRFGFLYDGMFDTAHGMVADNVGPKEGPRFFVYVFSLFLVILMCNLIGMVPYTFSSTAHIILTFGLGLGMLIGVTLVGAKTHRIEYFGLFFPPGSPIGMAPFLVFIEALSYVFRVVSISVRLFANIMSGHMLLKILCGFAFAMCIAPVSLSSAMISIFHLAPLAVVFLLIGMEFAVAIIQAFVFAMLTSIYINDNYNLH